MGVIITVLILLEAIVVLAWMDMNWNQITTLVQVNHNYVLSKDASMNMIHDPSLAICWIFVTSKVKPSMLVCRVWNVISLNSSNFAILMVRLRYYFMLASTVL